MIRRLVFYRKWLGWTLWKPAGYLPYAWWWRDRVIWRFLIRTWP